MSMMNIAATDGSGEFAAYVVAPSKPSAGAVVVIQEIFGVNDAMRATCEEIAALGFIAICPDLFWRMQPGINLTDKSPEEWQQAFGLMQKFDQQKGIEDLVATLAVARKLPGSNGRAGTIGYCLGGRLAFMMAAQSDADVNISYYGVGLDGLLTEIGKIHNKLLVHVADQDQFFPAEGRAKLVEATASSAQISTYVYDADHAFARIGGTHWNALAATIANGRSAEALVAALAPA